MRDQLVNQDDVGDVESLRRLRPLQCLLLQRTTERARD